MKSSKNLKSTFLLFFLSTVLLSFSSFKPSNFTSNNGDILVKKYNLEDVGSVVCNNVQGDYEFAKDCYQKVVIEFKIDKSEPFEQIIAIVKYHAMEKKNGQWSGDKTYGIAEQIINLGNAPSEDYTFEKVLDDYIEDGIHKLMVLEEIKQKVEYGESTYNREYGIFKLWGDTSADDFSEVPSSYGTCSKISSIHWKKPVTVFWKKK